MRRKRPSYRVVPAPEQELRLAAEHWANSYRIALEDAAEVGGVTVVRFEDFVADPEATVRRLCEALELDFEEAMVPRAGDTMPFATLPGDRKWYPIYPDAWLDDVTEREAEIVERRCGSLAERLGYRRVLVSAASR